MRLLPVRADHVGHGAARQNPQSERRRYRHRDERQHLSLRDLRAHPGGDQAGRQPDLKEAAIPTQVGSIPIIRLAKQSQDAGRGFAIRDLRSREAIRATCDSGALN